MFQTSKIKQIYDISVNSDMLELRNFYFFHILKFKCFVQNGSTWTIKKF